MPIAYMGIGTRAHRIITIIPISIVTIKIMHAISILYSSLCSLNAAMRTMALTSAIIPIPFHNHESSCINCIVVTSFLKPCRRNMGLIHIFFEIIYVLRTEQPAARQSFFQVGESLFGLSLQINHVVECTEFAQTGFLL